jgi:ABC-2 type transport system permease protein
MFKTLEVARREFVATVLTKAFFIGVFILPVLLTLTIPIAGLLVSNKAPDVRGSVAIIDLSRPEPGRTGQAIVDLLSPESIAEHQKALLSVAVPRITPELLSSDTDIEKAKEALKEGTTFDGSRLAVVVVEPDAVSREPDKPFGSYQVFVKQRLDARAQRLITDLVTKAIIRTRLAVNGENPEEILAMTRLQRPEPRSVTKDGQEKSSGELQQFLLPVGFMMLLWVSVFTSGQFLMTSTIEEKSNRIMEVLLSAVSPMQLMGGKILGQMAAGLLIMGVYSGFGIGSLLFFNRGDLIDGTNFIFLVAFFFIAFFTIASMMAAVGAAVTDIHEAQALLMPVMLVVLIPMILMMPIISNPSGRMATILSFIPPISPFVMVLRMSSSQPPPMWQLLLAVGIGVVSVYIALRVAAKIFRIGVLMYGKPPNFATLVRWARMA